MSPDLPTDTVSIRNDGGGTTSTCAYEVALDSATAKMIDATNEAHYVFDENDRLVHRPTHKAKKARQRIKRAVRRHKIKLPRH